MRRSTTVFDALFIHRVHLEGMVLKPNMVIAGKKCATQASPQEVAEATAALPAAARAGRGAGHRLPVRRAERGRGDAAPVAHEPCRSIFPGSSPSATAARCSRARSTPGAARPATSPPRSSTFLRRARLNGLARDGRYEAAMEQAAA